MVNKRDRNVSVEVVSRHQPVSDKTRDFAAERVGKLTRFHPRVSRIQVLLDEQHDQFITEIIVHVESGATIVSKEVGSGYRASITSAVEKLERQIKKDKEKRHDHNHDSLGEASGSPSTEAGDEETYDDVVRNELSKE